jgi:predicted glutamine amidotransferase
MARARQAIPLALAILAGLGIGLATRTARVPSVPEHACRFWGVIGTAPADPTVLDQLATGTHSLRGLASSNPDGWGLAYYSPRLVSAGLARPQVLRGGPPANNVHDWRFVDAVNELLALDANCAIVHIRAASSGHIGEPDPHPFVRGQLAFVHNGTIAVDDATTLLTQDDPDYLTTHPLDYADPESDSELFFYCILKLREQGVLRRDGTRSFSTPDAIAEAVLQLHLNTGILSAANCLFAMPDTLYAVRFDNSTSERYRARYRQITGGWVVASEPVGTDTTGWQEIAPKTLATFTRAGAPAFRTIYPPPGPYLIVQATMLDDSLGGNGDGGIDAGETLHMSIDLKNIGSEIAHGVTASLSTTAAHVTWKDSTTAYGDFQSGQVKPGLGGDHFVFTVAGNCPDQQSLPLHLVVREAGGETWDAYFSYTVDSPVIALRLVEINDDAGGDGDGTLEPGESAMVRLTLGNDGHAPASGLSGTLSSLTDTLSVTQPVATADTIKAATDVALAPDYQVTLDAHAIAPGICRCVLAVAGDWGLTLALSVTIPIGGFRDDMESGVGSWTHAVVTPGFEDQWHLSTYRNHSTGGTRSWKFGGTNAVAYADSADGGLVTPPISILQHTTLSFWHWMDAEVVIGGQGDAYDGGIVEMSVNGADWQQITPVGGYPYRIRTSIRPGPFPIGTMVFSGTHTWEPESFTINSDGGTIRFRFRFGSNGTVHREGWYIDDVQVLSYSHASAIGDPPQQPQSPSFLGASSPNPFSPATRIRFSLPEARQATLRILDAQGRLVRTLIDGRVPAGEQTALWDGQDERGQSAASGVYFYRLQSGDLSETRKLTRVR